MIGTSCDDRLTVPHGAVASSHSSKTFHLGCWIVSPLAEDRVRRAPFTSNVGPLFALLLRHATPSPDVAPLTFDRHRQFLTTQARTMASRTGIDVHRRQTHMVSRRSPNIPCTAHGIDGSSRTSQHSARTRCDAFHLASQPGAGRACLPKGNRSKILSHLDISLQGNQAKSKGRSFPSDQGAAGESTRYLVLFVELPRCALVDKQGSRALRQRLPLAQETPPHE